MAHEKELSEGERSLLKTADFNEIFRSTIISIFRAHRNYFTAPHPEQRPAAASGICHCTAATFVPALYGCSFSKSSACRSSKDNAGDMSQALTLSPDHTPASSHSRAFSDLFIWDTSLLRLLPAHFRAFLHQKHHPSAYSQASAVALCL